MKRDQRTAFFSFPPARPSIPPVLAWLTAAVALAAGVGVPPLVIAATGGAALDEIVVTAQKREEGLQEVPISVSVFTTDQLDRQQIDTFSDLQFNVPNVSYTKANFAGSNFSIRGLGTVAVGTSADSGVGVNINDVYLQVPRLFETEYYDVEQIEVLRGPQGTLFGRNATAGAINMKTVRPTFDAVTGDFEAQAGNYDHRKVKGALNLPISDKVAARVAGIWLDRGGYTDNVFTGDDVDDRSQWSVRASLRVEPTDGTRIDLIAHHFDEDSSRTRSQKQFCDFDPSGILGCLPTRRDTDATNVYSTLAYILPSTLILGDTLGLFDPIADPASPDGNPEDFRKISAAFEPRYEAEEDFVMLEVVQALGEELELTFIAAYQKTDVVSEQDYNGTASGAMVTLPAAFSAVFPGATAFLGAGNVAPVSTVPDVDSSLGVPGGDFLLDETFGAEDTSTSFAKQTSFELRIASAFDGPFNFMLAGSTFDFESETDYFVRAAGLDYFALVSLGPTAAPDASFNYLAPGFFNNETTDYQLNSWSVFGESYYRFADTAKLTIGLRYNVDEKRVRDRSLLFDVPVVVDLGSGQVTALGVPVVNIDETVQAGAEAGVFDADPNTPGAQAHRQATVEFKEWTGRVVLDWMPDLSFTDETLMYVSYARGYKGGGLNAPIDGQLFPNTPEAFQPEEVGAYEVGAKNQFWDNRFQANLAAFYYDYSDLQVSKIVNRTSVNENIDADLYGMEAELLFAPGNWRLNANLSYLKSKLGELETVDPRDPTQGRQDVTLIKDVEASHCVLGFTGQGPVSANAALQGALAANAVPYLPTGAATGLPATPGVLDSAISSCEAMQQIAPLFGYTYAEGVTTDVDGNDLPNSPELTVSLGVQYTFLFGNGAALSGRLDYYWQDEYSARIFGRTLDMVDAWDVWNAQATYTSATGRWWMRAFVQNIEDDDDVTGIYSTDPSSGLFTNAFLIEPRLMGVSVGVKL